MTKVCHGGLPAYGDVLRLLAECPGGLSFEAIGHKLGISEDAVRSIVTMLAQDGKLRIYGGARV